MRTRSKYRLMVLCLFVLFSAAVWAAGSGSWTGTLRDANGNPVIGAKIQLRAADGALVVDAIATDAGAFVLTGIAPGNYHVDVSIGAKNWQSESVVTIRDGEAIATDLQLASQNQEPVLHLLPAQQEVSSAPGESRKQGSGGEHLSSGAVSSLPLNARDFSKLLLLAAGTMTDANGTANFTQQFAVNGQRGTATVFA